MGTGVVEQGSKAKIMATIRAFSWARLAGREVRASACDARARLPMGKLLPCELGLPTYWSDWPNFGDQIAPSIVRAVSGYPALPVHRIRRRKILTVGSIVHRAKPGDTVWGSGALSARELRLKDVDVRALRGPRTAEALGLKHPVVYGDPGLLLPWIHRPDAATSSRMVGFIPHALEHDDLVGMIRGTHVQLIDVGTKDWRSVVDQIVDCEVVYSSSLHGIVVAEAYGIPAVWVRPSERVVGGLFKYLDYYEGTDREAPSPESRWPLSGPRWDGVPAPPELPARRIASELLAAWPYELADR